MCFLFAWASSQTAGGFRKQATSALSILRTDGPSLCRGTHACYLMIGPLLVQLKDGGSAMCCPCTLQRITAYPYKNAKSDVQEQGLAQQCPLRSFSLSSLSSPLLTKFRSCYLRTSPWQLTTKSSFLEEESGLLIRKMICLSRKIAYGLTGASISAIMVSLP